VAAKKMTAEAKARLQAAAAAKKARYAGRETLAGLDPTTGLVLLDRVQDNDGARADYRLRGTAGDGAELTVGAEYPPLARDVKFRFVRSLRERPNGPIKIARDKQNGCRLPWVRVKHAPAWLIQQFAARWDYRTIFVDEYRPDGSIKFTRPLFPTAVVIDFFKTLWADDEPEPFAERCRKYLVGYTDWCVRVSPGVGSLVTCSDASFAGIAGEVVGWHPTAGRPLAEFSGTAGEFSTGPTRVLYQGYHRDTWDVVGVKPGMDWTKGADAGNL
jgi:hypothetical protein